MRQSVTDIFDEVSEDLRADRARLLAKRYGWVLVLTAVLIVAGVGGWQAWRWNQIKQADAVATSFLNAMRDAGGPGQAMTPARTQAEADFLRLANSGPEGYRTLARLRAAALRADAGDLPGALTLWDQLAADTSADPLLRDLANLLWVQHQVDAGDPAAVLGRLAPLVAPGNPWRALALENQALLDIRTNEPGKARDILRQLAADAASPDGVRARANGLLARLGEPVAAPEPRTGG